MVNLTDLGSRSVALVSNPLAGKGKAMELADQLEARLRQLGISFAPFSVDWPLHFNGFTEVWLVGGDGTLNRFINSYPQLSIPVALYKGGSGNDFAWKLYGHLPVQQYLELVLKGRFSPVDAGICNGKYFINGVGIGFDGEVVKAMGDKRFLSAGHFAYLWVVVKKLFSYKENELVIWCNGNSRTNRYFMVSVANGSRYGGGFLVAPEASLQDGQFDIISIKEISRLKRFFYLPTMEKGNHLALPFVEFRRSEKIEINSGMPVAAHLDGELMEDKQFEIEMMPGKFHFFF